jgi:FlaA1/EpsC-like NDP-sugar epimerase
VEAFYRRELFPQKAECDLAYFSTANLFSDGLQIVKGVWVSVTGLFNWRDFLHTPLKLIVLDLVLIGMAWGAGNILYFPSLSAALDNGNLSKGLTLATPLLVFAMLLGGSYRYPLKYFSLYDLGRLLLTITVAWYLIFLLLLVLNANIPVYLAHIIFFILIAILPLPRLFYHFWWRMSLPQNCGLSTRIIIYGAGQAGFALATWLGNRNLVGFLDDNPDLKGKRIRGFCVLGHENDILIIHQRYPFDQIWLTFKPEQDKLSRLQTVCRQKGIDLFVLPDIKPFDILNRQQA